MEQYEKSGPPVDPAKQIKKQQSTEIQRLEELYKEQSSMIKDLQTEIRRLKAKMDAHALMINQMRKNG